MTPFPQEEASLQALIAKAKNGDTVAFGEIYNLYFQPIYRYTAFRLQADVAEDVVADIFVKAWEKIHTYNERKGIPFGAWLFRIARYTVIDVYRKDRNFEEVPEEIADPDDWNRADSAHKRGEILQVVQAAMKQLSPRYRDILVLSYIAELPHKEVARVLKMTEGGVRILKMRALRKLESHLPPDIRK